jgi:hypothetical protein
MRKNIANAEDAVLWLRWLKTEIREPFILEMITNMDGRTHHSVEYAQKRPLQPSELELLKKIAMYFVVEPHIACSGFNFGITLFAHPSYPTLPLEWVISITGEDLPEGMNKQFDGAWEELSPLSHNANNLKNLVRYGMQPTREKSYYDY